MPLLHYGSSSAKPFPETDSVLYLITQRTIEGHHGAVRRANLKIDLGTARSGQTLLRSGHQRTRQALAPVGGTDGKMVNPPSDSVKRGQHCSGYLARDMCD